jgi:hypothetical protein
MNAIRGGCYCGNIQVELELSKELGHYHPRVCDCDFCRKHGAAYLSDSRGTLRIRTRDPSRSGTFRQGNELADMLLCAACGVLVGAVYSCDDGVYATVNARVIDGAPAFGGDEPVSPKQLSGEEKIARWRKIWFHNVTLL